MPHIAIDIDGVLADYVGGLLPVVSVALGRELREEQITTYLFEHAFSITPEVWAALWAEHEHRLYAEALPYDGVREALLSLHSIARLTIQTGRPTSAHEATRTWFHTHFDLDLPLEFRPDRPKYAAEDGVDYFIDDHGETLARATSTGRGFVVDRPWNRLGVPEHVVRVGSFAEAAGIIEAELR